MTDCSWDGIAKLLPNQFFIEKYTVHTQSETDSVLRLQNEYLKTCRLFWIHYQVGECADDSDLNNITYDMESEPSTASYFSSVATDFILIKM